MSSSTVPSGAPVRAPAGGPRGLVGRAFGRAPEPVQRLSRWSWTADAMLALALAVSALQSALDQGGGPGLVPPAYQAGPSGPH
ncbi:hypothetical protein ACSNOI_40425, partial [Actinomadura kijaniata]|uniref:hypothetical protein n=1 Tax=Actinomadura kijaniata TaxID=46161 RepID=UPI003F1A8906